MKCLLILFLLISTTASSQTIYENSRLRTIGSVAVYGTVGGALLGTAALAFGGRPRGVAQGASLGLYAGLAFGSYIVLSYIYKTNLTPEDYPLPEEEESWSGDSGWGFGKVEGWAIGVPLLSMSF